MSPLARYFLPRSEDRTRSVGRTRTRVLWLLGVLGVVSAFTVVYSLPLVLVPSRGLDAVERVKAENDLRGVLVQAVGGTVLLVGSWRTLHINREGQITERFTRAIEHLGQSGSDKLDVRLGGIYALERIARDSRIDRGPIVEILTAFLREHSRTARDGGVVESASEQKAVHRLGTDTQAAVTVLTRQLWANDQVFDLSFVNLAGANLHHANLTGADLAGADLSGANLVGANLSFANLLFADLANASLTRADLTYAQLNQASLTLAFLTGANLTGANLNRASLASAFLDDADLTDADLTDADLTDAHLTGADLTRAHLRRAILTNARLTRANLTLAVLTEADLTGADLSSAFLLGAKLTGAKLSDANLTGADLTGTKLTERQRLGANLPP